MPLPANFKDKYGPWALITGASSGIGEQFAELLATAGLNVILVARRKDRIDKLADSLTAKYNVKTLALCADLASPNAIEQLHAACKEQEIGLLICNAGTGAKGIHHETSLQQLNNILDLNSRAPMLLTHAFAPDFIRRGRGGIIITASIEAYLGFPYSAAYSASKAFAKTLGEGLWSELKPHHVDVLVLNPGATDTEILAAQGIDSEQMVGLMSPQAVAEYALHMLGKKPVVIAGLMNQVFIKFLTLIPRSLAITLAGIGMKNAIDKSRS
jgi:short-subunit dehydrogenase